MNGYEIRPNQHKSALPLYVVLTWAVVANIIDGINLYEKTVLVGSTYAAERIILIIMLLIFISGIHLKSARQNDPADNFLNENLPPLLFGFGLSCVFFSVFPFYVGILFGLSGYLLYVDRNER